MDASDPVVNSIEFDEVLATRQNILSCGSDSYLTTAGRTRISFKIEDRMRKVRVGKVSQSRQQINVTNRVEVLGVDPHCMLDHTCDLRSAGLTLLQELPVNVVETRLNIGISGNRGPERAAEKRKDYSLFSQESEESARFRSSDCRPNSLDLGNSSHANGFGRRITLQLVGRKHAQSHDFEWAARIERELHCRELRWIGTDQLE